MSGKVAFIVAQACIYALKPGKGPSARSPSRNLGPNATFPCRMNTRGQSHGTCRLFNPFGLITSAASAQAPRPTPQPQPPSGASAQIMMST
jgi:hypothetical protein